jgi:hypothetical protein
MAATIEQLLVNNPNWSYAEIGVAYIAWDAAIKYAEAKFTSTNKPSTPVAADKYVCGKCGFSGDTHMVRDHKCGEWPQPAHVG